MRSISSATSSNTQGTLPTPLSMSSHLISNYQSANLGSTNSPQRLDWECKFNFEIFNFFISKQYIHGCF
jgi:hypothetical protein